MKHIKEPVMRNAKARRNEALNRALRLTSDERISVCIELPQFRLIKIALRGIDRAIRQVLRSADGGCDGLLASFSWHEHSLEDIRFCQWKDEEEHLLVHMLGNFCVGMRCIKSELQTAAMAEHYMIRKGELK